MLFASCLCLHGCTQGKQSFLVIQFCLVNDLNLTHLRDTLATIAHAERMKFIDDSAIVKENMKDLGTAQRAPTISLRVEQGDGLGLTATNVGLPGYQVAIGFTAGADKNLSRTFADRVVQELKKNWDIKTVPSGRGAFPLSDCPA
jgi:hypothetical protein